MRYLKMPTIQPKKNAARRANLHGYGGYNHRGASVDHSIDAEIDQEIAERKRRLDQEDAQRSSNK